MFVDCPAHIRPTDSRAGCLPGAMGPGFWGSRLAALSEAKLVACPPVLPSHVGAVPEMPPQGTGILGCRAQSMPPPPMQVAPWSSGCARGPGPCSEDEGRWSAVRQTSAPCSSCPTVPPAVGFCSPELLLSRAEGLEDRWASDAGVGGWPRGSGSSGPWVVF